MLIAGAKVFRAYLQDAVGVDHEFHFDARQSGGRGGNSQREPRERAAVFGQFAFALENVDVNAGLIVDAGGVKFLRARGDRGVARDNFCYRAAVSFDAKRKRRNVEQQHSFYALIENAGLRGGAQRHDLIGIQFDVRLAAEKFLDGAADQRSARGAAHENDFVHVGGLELRVGESLLDGAHGAVDDGSNKGVESAACELVNEDFAIWQCKTKRGGLSLGELMLHVDQRFAKLLRELAVRREIDFIVLENQFVDKSLQKIVDVVAAEMGVAVGGENLIDVAVAGGNELENGDIEGAATEIVHGDFAALLLVKAIGERGRSGLVDEAENFEAGNFASVLGGLALGIIEIRGDSDDGAVDGFAEVGLGPIF